MRHLGQVGDDGVAGNVFAQADRDAAGGLAERIRVDDIAQIDTGQLFIRHFDADGRFAGNRRFDADIRGGQFQGDIIG